MDICAIGPERAAPVAADHNTKAKLEGMLQMVNDLRYETWRDFSGEDTVRFLAFRLRDIGMLWGTPQELFAQGTDGALSICSGRS